MSKIFLAEYGVSTTIPFSLFEVDGVNFRTDAAHASGDTFITKNEGAEANTTNSFTDEGTGYSIVLTATELTAARIHLFLVDQTATKVWLDTDIVIMTFGHASAQFETFPSDVISIAGDTQSATDLKDFADAGYDPATNKVQGVVLVDTTTTNTDMVGTDSAALASVCTESRLAELDAGNLPTDIADIPTTAEFNARTLPSADYVVVTDTIARVTLVDTTTTNTDMLTAADVNAEVVDALNVDTYAEPGQGAPAATESLAAKINYMYKAWRNKKTQTATEFSLYNDAGAVVDQKATVSDDATTATVGEIVTGA